MGLITQLQSVTQGMSIHGVGGARTGPMGYVVMKVQVEGVTSYRTDDDARPQTMGHQASYPEDQANLPNGLYVLSTYTQLNNWTRVVTMWL